MLIVTGLIEIQPKDVDAFKKAAIQMMAATNAEAGCDIYKLYQDLENPGLFRLYEEWQSQEALSAHLEEPHVGKFLGFLRGLEGVSSEIKKVTGGMPGPLR